MSAIRGVGTLALRELAVRSMIPASEVVLPRATVQIVGSQLAKSAASRELVPVATKALGEWGESRLATFLGGQGVKPLKAFKTPFGARYSDRMLNGISYESKAGLNVKLTRQIERQIAKDAYLIKRGRIDGAEWHFWRGAQPKLIQALQNAGIKAVVH